jgi:hypothetical protein
MEAKSSGVFSKSLAATRLRGSSANNWHAFRDLEVEAGKTLVCAALERPVTRCH